MVRVMVSPMVVDDFNLLGTRIRPNEAQPPLIIDPDGMFSCAAALQRLKMIARW